MDEPRPYLQSAENVHRRALALAYLACRAMIDGNTNPNAAKMAENIKVFTKGVGIDDQFLAPEARLLSSPFGSLAAFQRFEASWLVEGMVVLAWSLGKAELPRFDTKCNAGPGSMALGMFRPGTKEKLGASVLRDPEEIENAAVRYLALNWRIGKFASNPLEKFDLVASLQSPGSPHLVVDGIDLHDGDLVINGLPLGRVPRERLEEIFGIVRERFNALKWLQGYSANYSANITQH